MQVTDSNTVYECLYVCVCVHTWERILPSCSSPYLRPGTYIAGIWNRCNASLPAKDTRISGACPLFASISYRLRLPPKFSQIFIMDVRKCLLILGLVYLTAAQDDSGFFDKSYRAAYRVYEDCHQRNVGVSACLKKKAISYFDRLVRIDSLPISENLELVKAPDAEIEPVKNISDLESTLGRTSGASRDDVLNDILLDRVSSLMNSFNVQIRLPKTSPTELKRSMEEGRGKMKKMMGMMMMGMAMKMAAMVPIAMGVLFLLAGKALIISKIALVLSMIIGLKKLLSQKQSSDHGHGWQSGGGGGGWDRSLKNIQTTVQDREYAHSLAFGASRPQ